MSRCAIDTCRRDTTDGRPLCDGHWRLVPVGVRECIVDAQRLRLPISLGHYTATAVAVAKAASNEPLERR